MATEDEWRTFRDMLNDLGLSLLPENHWTLVPAVVMWWGLCAAIWACETWL